MTIAETKAEVCRLIMEDMKNDVMRFDGQPFSGKIVGEYFGNQAAAISALASIVEKILSGEIVLAVKK